MDINARGTELNQFPKNKVQLQYIDEEKDGEEEKHEEQSNWVDENIIDLNLNYNRATETMPALHLYESNESEDELSILINTINEITNTNEENSIFSSSFLPTGGVNPYITKEEIQTYPEDDKIFCHGSSLTHWRKLFLSLSQADPFTLQAYVNTIEYIPKDSSSTSTNTKLGKNTQRENTVVRVPPSQGRFKQIARAKSTPEYIFYSNTIPRDLRSPNDPATPRVDGSSWREFQQNVRAWKRSLHRRYEMLTGTQPPEHVLQRMQKNNSMQKHNNNKKNKKQQ